MIVPFGFASVAVDTSVQRQKLPSGFQHQNTAVHEAMRELTIDVISKKVLAGSDDLDIAWVVALL